MAPKMLIFDSKFTTCKNLNLLNHSKERIKFLTLRRRGKNLVEHDIAEQIVFFNLNHPSSSIVIKVDFDLSVSLLAHNLYRELSSELPGFENCTASTIYRKFLDNGAMVKAKGNNVIVYLKKKTQLPILFEVPWMKDTTYLSWMGVNIKFIPGNIS